MTSISSSISSAGITFLKLSYKQYEKISEFLTSKQIGHIQNVVTRKTLLLFIPDSRDTAIFQKYYGLQCPKCESWRVHKILTDKPEGQIWNVMTEYSFKEKTVSK